MTEEELMRVREAAMILNISTAAIYAAIKEGRIKAVKKYGMLLISKKELALFERSMLND